MYKNMGLSIKEAALYASSFGLPFTIKPLWASFLEMYKTKKYFVVLMQLVCALGVAAAAIAVGADNFVASTMACFWIIGFAGSTQDIASDGVYVTTLDAKTQAKWTGVQGMCWNIGPVIAQGPLVTLTGVLHSSGMSWAESWRIVLFIIAGIMLAASIWHMQFLPTGSKAANTPKSFKDGVWVFWDSLVTFFQKDSVWLMIAFAFLFRTSQGFLDKIGPLFMIDGRETGGLGLGNEVFGMIVGTVGTPGFILGALLGGFFVASKGLKKVMILLCLAVNIPNATYLFLGYFQPENVYFIGTVVTLEKFFFGFGSVCSDSLYDATNISRKISNRPLCICNGIDGIEYDAYWDGQRICARIPFEFIRVNVSKCLYPIFHFCHHRNDPINRGHLVCPI